MNRIVSGVHTPRPSKVRKEVNKDEDPKKERTEQESQESREDVLVVDAVR